MIDKGTALFIDWCELDRCPDRITSRKAGAISLILRRLLLENLIHENNRQHRLNIRFPIQPLSRVTHSGRASFEGVPEFQDVGKLKYPKLVVPYRLSAFLAHKLLCLDGQRYSIRDLVNLMANKLGGVHFDKSLVRGDLPFDPYDPEVANALCAALVIIARATCLAIGQLAKKCSPLPSYDQCIGHYQVGRGVVDFDEHSWMETDLSNVGAISELAWSAVLEPKPIRSEQEIIYSLAGHADEQINILLNYNGDLSLDLQFPPNYQRVTLSDRGRVRPIGKTIYIQIALSGGEQQSGRLEMQGHRSGFKLKEPIAQFAPKRAVLGADQTGNRGAGFRLNELFVTRTTDAEILLQLRDYFIARYKFDA